MSEPERVCDRPKCGNAACVHLTQVVDDKTSTEYLCKDCARAKGVSAVPAEGSEVADFMAQLAEGVGERGPDAAPQPCAQCGLTFGGFRETGRLGCPRCYTSFESGMRRLLGRIHGATRHVGKVYSPPDPDATHAERRLDDLRRRLRRAVDSEDFERAAVLRDQISEIELVESS